MDILILEESCQSIRIVRFRLKGSSLTFMDADRFHLVDEENFDTLCKKLATDEEVKEKVVLSLHPATFFYREMELPISDKRRVREILPLELKGETALDTDESIFESLPLEDGKFLVTWGSRQGISSQIEYMAKMDLEPQIVTSAPFHWQSLIPVNAAEYVALSDGTALSVHHNRALVYFRAISEEGTEEELGKTLAALECSRGIKVEQVYLFGEAVNRCSDLLTKAIPGAPVFLRLPLEEKVMQTFRGNRDKAIWLAGIWALADAAVSGSPVNFRYGDMSYTAGFTRTWKKWRLSAILAAMFLLLILVETGVRYYFVKRDLDSLDNSIREVYHEVFPNRKKAVDEVAELKSEIKRMGGYERGQNLLTTMKKLAEIKGDGISGFYETEFDGDQIRLKGDADSYQAVNDLKTRAGAIFAGADVGEIKSKPGGGVTFSFRGTLREEDK